MQKRLCCALILLSLLSGCAQSLPPPVDLPAVTPAPTPAAVPAASAAPAQAVVIGDTDPMTRALAAKMLATAFNDLSSINAMERVIAFADTEPGMWYDKYINAVFAAGIMSGSDGLFHPDGYITLAHAQALLDRLDDQQRVKLKLTDETRDKPISYALWLELFHKLLQTLGGGTGPFALTEHRIVVLATSANHAALNQWSVVTDRGPYACVGLNLDAYIDRELRVLVKDGDIIAVLAVESLSPKISNAYVTAADASGISVFSGGAERRYPYAPGVTPPRDAAGHVCDIVLSGGKAQEIILYTERVRDEIVRCTQNTIEFRERPALPLDSAFKIYDISAGDVRWKGQDDPAPLLVGTDIAAFIVRDGKARAAIITKKADPITLRVAIQTGGYGGLYHEQLTLSATTAFTIQSAKGSTRHSAWEEVRLSQELFGADNRVRLIADDGGKAVIVGLARAWPDGQNPKYRGTLEVFLEPLGYVIVNTLTMEEYLYAVVPSEMPSAYGVEASMVQAITARSYAYNQFYANRAHAYGANIDDSVSYQVYNNIPENETSIRAVDDTRGQTLTYNGEVIIANFFSTSAGYTANGGEVWAHGITRAFPTVTAEYLRAANQFEGADHDLSDEAVAAAFFKSQDIPAYDSDSSWFRWSVDMTAEEIAAAINDGIKGRYDANAPLIKTLQTDGVFRSTPVTSIGELKDLTVTRRGAGGNIMEMKVEGTAATVLIMTEYNVRALIKPVQRAGGAPIILRRSDASEVTDYHIMPSAFYTMDKTYADDGRLVSVTFTGGGNGHGAGMSQTGVRGMLEKGHSIPDILKHYYRGTEITEVY